MELIITGAKIKKQANKTIIVKVKIGFLKLMLIPI